MSNNFPPITTHVAEVEAVVEFLVCLFSQREAVYVSAPITSGKRLLEWHQEQKFTYAGNHPDQSVLSGVAEFNRTHARKVVQRLREAFNKPLMDPTVVADLRDWTQDDYRFLWACIIERYISIAVFVTDWNYSNGCAYEFLVAKQHGITTLDETLQPLSIVDGMKLIKDAITDISSHKIAATFLERVYNELSKLEHNLEGVYVS